MTSLFMGSVGRRSRLLALAAVSVFAVGALASDASAGFVPAAPAIVVRERPVDTITILRRNSTEILVGAGAVVAVGFFYRRLTRRRGDE